MKELLVLLEDELHARDINLHILTGICAGLHKPHGQTITDKMLSWSPPWPRRWNATSSANVPSTVWPPHMPRAAKADDPRPSTTTRLEIAISRRVRGESVTAIATHLQTGRSTLYRALEPHEAQAPTPPASS